MRARNVFLLNRSKKAPTNARKRKYLLLFYNRFNATLTEVY